MVHDAIEQPERNYEQVPILGKVFFDSKNGGNAGSHPVEGHDATLAYKINEFIITLDLIRIGKKQFLEKLNKETKKNKNSLLKEKLAHIIQRIESDEFKQTPEDIVTEIELAKTEEELEVIELEVRKRKIKLLGFENVLSEEEFLRLRSRKAAIREKIFEEDQNAIAKNLHEIHSLEEKERILSGRLYQKLGEQEATTKLLRLQAEILNALQQKIDHHKERLNFKKTRNAIYNNLALGIDALSSAADVLKFIPGLNFLFDAISITFETTALMLESFAYDEDEFIDHNLKRAMKEHLTAIRHFMRAELTSSVTAIGLFAGGLFFPPLLIAGAGMTLLGNILSIPRLNRAIEREKLRSDIKGHENRLKALESERSGRTYSVFGIIVLLAATTITLFFPPAGALIIASIVLTSVATLFAAAAIKKELERKQFENKAEQDKNEFYPKIQFEKTKTLNNALSERSHLQKDITAKDKLVSDLKHIEEDYQHLIHKDKNHKMSDIATMEIVSNIPAKYPSQLDFANHVVEEAKRLSIDQWHGLTVIERRNTNTNANANTAATINTHTDKTIAYSNRDDIIGAFTFQKTPENKLCFKSENPKNFSSIQLMAINLITTGDQSPSIRSGHPRDVLHLLQALEDLKSTLHPTISQSLLNKIDDSLDAEEQLALKAILRKYEKSRLNKDNLPSDDHPSFKTNH